MSTPGSGYVPVGQLPPPPNPASRRLVWLWVAVILLAVIVAAGGAGAWLYARGSGGPAKGDAALTVRLSAPGGGAPSAADLDRTRQILLNRLRQLKLTRPTVTAAGAGTLRVTVAHGDAERARAVLVPGNLTFRRVVSMAAGRSGAACKADPQDGTDTAAALAAAKTKLGATYDTAAALKDPADPAAAGLTGFDALTCAEVAALPPAMQYAVPAITCATLDARPPGYLDAAAQVAACDKDGAKYLLDAAKVAGTDLASADAKADPQQGGMWIVTVHFTAEGQRKWTDLTREAMDSGPTTQVGVLMDTQVLTAPTIQGVITGDAVITGGSLSTREHATTLAANLTHGVLPLSLNIIAIETVA